MLCGSHIKIWNLANHMKKMKKERQTLSFQFFTNIFCILMLFVLFFHMVFKISNFNKWTAKHLAKASCTKLTLRQELLKNSDDIIFLLGKMQWLLKNSSRFLEEFRSECLLRSQMALSKGYFRSKQKAWDSCSELKPNYFKKQCFFVIIFLRKVTIEVQSGNGVLYRLVPCTKCKELAC